MVTEAMIMAVKIMILGSAPTTIVVLNVINHGLSITIVVYMILAAAAAPVADADATC